MKQTFIYLIEAENGLVKIGYAATPRARLSGVRCHSPVLVRLIATWVGGPWDEAQLHQRFSAHRNHCEWFRIEGDLADFITEVRGRGLDEVEPWNRLLHTNADAAQRAKTARQRATLMVRFQDPSYRRSLSVGIRTQKRLAKAMAAYEASGRVGAQPSHQAIRSAVIAEIDSASSPSEQTGAAA